MNLTPLSVVIAGTGGILIYSAVRGYDPRDVVRGALSGEWPPAAVYSTQPSVAPAPAPDTQPRTVPTRNRRRRNRQPDNTSPTAWSPTTDTSYRVDV